MTNLLERYHCPHLTRELYRNRDACHEMITILGDCLELQLVELIHNTPFAGIMIDESTDLSVRKNLVVVLSKSGDVCCYFACLAEMKQCDAEALTEAIVQYLNQRKIDISKLSGLGSDGASVMVGKHNGVGVRMKCLNPFMLSNHRVAHKFALADENSASSVPYFKQHHSILRGLYNYFHTSHSHYSALKEMMNILHDPEVHIYNKFTAFVG